MILRFVMYTDKSVAQSMRAINDRIQTTGTRTRPQMDGWVDKSGRFAMAVSSTVRWRFRRKTFLHGRAERESGMTIVRGNVPGGLSRNKQALVLGMMIVIGLGLGFTQGSAILTIVAVLAGAAFSIPLQGDFDNSEILLSELQKALKAKFTPPNR